MRTKLKMFRFVAALLSLLLSVNVAMSWTFVQGNAGTDNSGATGTTATVTLTAPISATRNLVSGIVEFENDIPATLVSVKTDKGDTATIVDLAQDVPNGEAGQTYYFPTLTSGAQTITATFSTTTAFFRILALEHDPGVGNSFSLDVHAAQFQSTVTVGANCCTSGAATTTANGDVVLGYFGNTGGSPTMSASGTPNAFNGRTNVTGGGCVECLFSEDFFQTTAGSVAAIASSSGTYGTGGSLSMMMAFKIGGAPPPSSQTRRSLTGVGN